MDCTKVKEAESEPGRKLCKRESKICVEIRKKKSKFCIMKEVMDCGESLKKGMLKGKE